MGVRKQPKSWECPRLPNRCSDLVCEAGKECQQPGSANLTNIQSSRGKPSK